MKEPVRVHVLVQMECHNPEDDLPMVYEKTQCTSFPLTTWQRFSSTRQSLYQHLSGSDGDFRGDYIRDFAATGGEVTHCNNWAIPAVTSCSMPGSRSNR